MKKLTAVLLLALCLSGMPTSAHAADDDTWAGGIYVSAVNHDDDNEYVVLANSGPDVAIDNMTLEFFKESTGATPILVAGFSNGVFLANKSILIGKDSGGVSNLDVLYSGNQILQSKGRLGLTINGLPTANICWGSGASCVDAMSSLEMLASPCLIGTGANCPGLVPYVGPIELNSGTENYIGGWQPNLGTAPGTIVIYSGEKPVTPVTIIENPDCQYLQFAEIGANLNEQFVELANSSTKTINLKGCSIKTNRSSTQFFTFGDENLAPSALRLVKISDTALTLSKTVSGAVYVMLNDGETELQTITYPVPKSGTSYWLLDGAWKVSTQPSPGQINYLPPTNYCKDVKISELAANTSDQFIEIVNRGNGDVNLNGCRLMTNRSTTNYFAFGDEILHPNAFRAVKISDTNLTLTKTTSGTVYLISSDGLTEMDLVEYSDLDEDTSWSLVDSEWLQTYNSTAGAANIYQQYPACAAGYYRSLESGRCNKIAIAKSATLAACKEGYERNPLTNRCRKIATAASAGLKACAEGYERNPETNRCRKIVASAAAVYAVEPGELTGSNVSWLVAGLGVLGLTAAAVTFQYRMEISNLSRRLFAGLQKS